MLLIAWLSLLIWLVLLFARGGFWRARPAPALAAADIAAVGRPAASGSGAWPALVAVVPARNEADVIGRAVGSLLAQDYPGLSTSSSSTTTARTVPPLPPRPRRAHSAARTA